LEEFAPSFEIDFKLTDFEKLTNNNETGKCEKSVLALEYLIITSENLLL
jgi:hypothetical protein